MGATPASALALAVLPFGPSASQENELTDLLTGVGTFVCLWRVTVFYRHHLQAALLRVSSIAT